MKTSNVAKLPEVQVKEVVIPAPNTVDLLVQFEGATSLIMHNFSQKAQQQIADKQAKKASKAKQKRDPKAEYEGAFYRDEDGDPAIPTINFKAAMLRIYKFAGFSNKNEIRFGIFLPGKYVKILGEPHMATDPVRLGGMSNPADLRYRPEFDQWSGEVRVTLTTDIISIDQFLNAFTMAGRMCGVGDWRPEKSSGNHGLWTIKNAVILEEVEA